MTCIVGLATGGTVWIGGDSAGSDWRLALQIRADAKVFRNGPYLVGGSGSFRLIQLLRYAVTLPEPNPDEDLDRFMVTKFVDAVRQCFKDGGFAKKEYEKEEGGSFLVGYRGALFQIDSDYQVGRPACDYGAIGCGDLIAVGAMYAAAGSPEKRVRRALEAAEQFSCGVRAPFTILSTAGRKGREA